jgi:cyanophycinase
MTKIHLMGGGNLLETAREVFGPFLADITSSHPEVACLVLDEGNGAARYARFARALQSAGRCKPFPVIASMQQPLPQNLFLELDADALLVCGGSTPGYAYLLKEVRTGVQTWLSGGDRAYAGYSAGAVMASADAIVGGRVHNGIVVCPEGAAEGIEQVTISAGIGLVPWPVEPHGAAWGTVSRLIALVNDATIPSPGLCIDEDTTLSIGDDSLAVQGLGCVHVVRRVSQGVKVESYPNGSRLTDALFAAPSS